MGAIKLNPTAASSIVSQMKVKRDNIETYYGNMSTEVASLVSEGYMEGDAAESFVNEFTEKMNPTIDAALEVIDSCITQIEGLVGYLQQIEKDLFSGVFS